MSKKIQLMNYTYAGNKYEIKADNPIEEPVLIRLRKERTE